MPDLLVKYIINIVLCSNFFLRILGYCLRPDRWSTLLRYAVIKFFHNIYFHNLNNWIIIRFLYFFFFFVNEGI